MRIFQKLTRWYNGTPYENKPEDPFIVIGHMVRTKSAIRTRKAVNWSKKNYQWLLGMIGALIGILLAVFK